MHGTLSKSVTDLPIMICRNIRSKIYSLLGVSWPFRYKVNDDTFDILVDKSPSEVSNYDIKTLFFCLGPCIKTEIDYVPKIRYRLREKTTQGKVMMAEMSIDNAQIAIIIKANYITRSEKPLWIYGKKPVFLKTPKGNYQVIAKSYMDALCSIILSRLVEKHVSPHFPICYATAMNRALFKRLREEEMDDDRGELCQTIWMEYLVKNMYEVLSVSKDHRIWWSCIFQVAAALTVAQKRYGFIHQDLHSVNVRVRCVKKKTILYYETSDNVLLEVDTGGYVIVIIDFGRSMLKPWENEDPLISSVFYGNGECSGVSCDNNSIDLIRLVCSLHDVTDIIQDRKERESIQDFFKNICTTRDGQDYYSKIATLTKENFNYMIESFPRKHCWDAIPKKIIPMFYNMYRTNKIPDGVVPYKLDLS